MPSLPPSLGGSILKSSTSTFPVEERWASQTTDTCNWPISSLSDSPWDTGAQGSCHLYLTGSATARTSSAAEAGSLVHCFCLSTAATVTVQKEGTFHSPLRMHLLTSQSKSRSALGLAGQLPLTYRWSKGKVELTFWKGQSKLQLCSALKLQGTRSTSCCWPTEGEWQWKRDLFGWSMTLNLNEKDRSVQPSKKSSAFSPEYFFMTRLTLRLTLGQASEALLTREGGIWNIAYLILRERKGQVTDMLKWAAHFQI